MTTAFKNIDFHQELKMNTYQRITVQNYSNIYWNTSYTSSVIINLQHRKLFGHELLQSLIENVTSMVVAVAVHNLNQMMVVVVVHNQDWTMVVAAHNQDWMVVAAHNLDWMVVVEHIQDWMVAVEHNQD